MDGSDFALIHEAQERWSAMRPHPYSVLVDGLYQDRKAIGERHTVRWQFAKVQEGC